MRVDCRLPRNAKFDYAAVSLRAGDDAFAGVTEVWSIVLMEGVAGLKRIDLLMLFLKGLGLGFWHLGSSKDPAKTHVEPSFYYISTI